MSDIISKKHDIHDFFNMYQISISLDLDDRSVDIVYELCMYDKIDESIYLTTNCAFYVGTYYMEIKKNPIKANKYFSMTNNDVLCDLAFHYQKK